MMRYGKYFVRAPLCGAILIAGGFCVPTAEAASKKDAGTEAPVLLSTDGGKSQKPAWKNIDQLKQLAAKGNPAACFELADRSVEGDGVPKDLKQAIALFETAAKGGVVNGWFRLGKIYHDGLVDAPDYNRALDYFTLAARARVTEAQHNIGAMLVSARGVKRNYVEGLAWLIVATKSGAPPDAGDQVRQRLAQKPDDIQAAEARAAEILADLPHATVNAVRKDAPPDSALTPPPQPSPPVIDNPLEKPSIIPPKIDPPDLPKISVPLPAPEPGKP